MRKKFLCLLLIFSTLILSGCFAKEISSAEILRDEAKVGGSLSCVYNQKDRCVYIGGEGRRMEKNFIFVRVHIGIYIGYRIPD